MGNRGMRAEEILNRKNIEKGKSDLLENESSRGRPKKDVGEKAQVVRVGLYREDFDCLENMPGKSESEKIRHCIREVSRMYQREGRQVQGLESLIFQLESVCTKITDPEHRSKRSELIEKFNNLHRHYFRIMDVIGLEFGTLKKHLSEDALLASDKIARYYYSISNGAFSEKGELDQ